MEILQKVQNLDFVELTMKKICLFVISSLFLAFTSCNLPGKGNSDLSFSLPATLFNTTASTSNRNEIAVDFYKISLSSNNGFEYQKDCKPSKEIHFENLEPGFYQIIINAYDSNEKMIAWGEGEAVIEIGITTPVTIALHICESSENPDNPYNPGGEKEDNPSGGTTDTPGQGGSSDIIVTDPDFNYKNFPEVQIPSQGFFVTINPDDEAWYYDGTNYFTLTNLKETENLFLAYYNEKPIEISGISVTDFSWSNIGQGKVTINAISPEDGQPMEKDFELVHKYYLSSPETTCNTTVFSYNAENGNNINFGVQPSNFTLTLGNGENSTSISFDSIIYLSYKLRVLDADKKELKTLEGTQREELNSLSFTLNELNILNIGTYYCELEVKQLTSEYSEYIFNPNSTKNTFEITVVQY